MLVFLWSFLCFKRRRWVSDSTQFLSTGVRALPTIPLWPIRHLQYSAFILYSIYLPFICIIPIFFHLHISKFTLFWNFLIAPSQPRLGRWGLPPPPQNASLDRLPCVSPQSAGMQIEFYDQNNAGYRSSWDVSEQHLRRSRWVIERQKSIWNEIFLENRTPIKHCPPAWKLSIPPEGFDLTFFQIEAGHVGLFWITIGNQTHIVFKRTKYHSKRHLCLFFLQIE